MIIKYANNLTEYVSC